MNGYAWNSINNGAGTVVDVGGANGHVSTDIAQVAPGLKFVVQDLPAAINGAETTISPDLTDRIQFMPHDFFTEQPIKADAYIFRMIFHDWSDTYVIKILQAMVPAMRPGVRIIVNDNILPRPGQIPHSKEKKIRYV